MPKSLIALLFCCSLSCAPAPAQSPTSIPRQDKIERLNALLDALHLPLITSSDSVQLIRAASSYRAWAVVRQSSLDASISANDDKKEPPKDWPYEEDVASTLYQGSVVERYFTATQEKLEIVQQPRTILEQQGTTTVPVANPDHVLYRGSATTTWATVFTSVVDVHDQAKVFSDSKFKVPNGKGMICGSSYGNIQLNKSTASQNLDSAATPFLNCIMRIGSWNRTQRIFSGFKTQFNIGQNPQVQQGFNVLGTPAATKNHALSGEIDFDPKSLFISGSDWNNAYETAKSYDGEADGIYTSNGAMKALRNRVSDRCSGKLVDYNFRQITTACINRIAGMNKWQRVGAFLIPQFTEVIKNQFDYVKQSGNLIAAPYATKSLSDVTITFDISHLIPSSKQRGDAMKMLIAMSKDKQAKPAPDVVTLDPKQDALALYLDFAGEPEKLDDDKWYESFRKALSNAIITRMTAPRMLATTL